MGGLVLIAPKNFIGTLLSIWREWQTHTQAGPMILPMEWILWQQEVMRAIQWRSLIPSLYNLPHKVIPSTDGYTKPPTMSFLAYNLMTHIYALPLYARVLYPVLHQSLLLALQSGHWSHSQWCTASALISPSKPPSCQSPTCTQYIFTLYHWVSKLITTVKM